MGRVPGQTFSFPSFKPPKVPQAGTMYASAPEAERESSGTQACDGREHLPLCFLDHRMGPTVLREPVAPGPGEQGRARVAGTSLRPQQACGARGGLGGQGQGSRARSVSAYLPGSW